MRRTGWATTLRFAKRLPLSRFLRSILHYPYGESRLIIATMYQHSR